MIQTLNFGTGAADRPSLDLVPPAYRDRLADLFDTWGAVEGRNRALSRYYDMKNEMKGLGISVPPQCERVNSVVGWCSKAVKAHVNRSTFDGYVLASGDSDERLDALVRGNRLASLYKSLCSGSLVHGISAATVMGAPGGAKVRAFSANQCCALWDKDEGRIACGVTLAGVGRSGEASRYVAHFPDCVLTLSRVYATDPGGAPVPTGAWACGAEPHRFGRPLMEVFPNDPDLDRPLGHSMLTPELLGIVDKAMRDVLRMEIGAEFFTFPQRYALGVADDLFAAPVDPGAPTDEDGDPVDADGNKLPRPTDEYAKLRAYLGALWTFTRDENGDVPAVGQFSPTSAENFTMTFENDAQRFSGATNVPLAQLGVLSNTYTSSDALGAANDPLILEVQAMNLRNREVMATVGRMMAAVALGVPIADLPDEYRTVQAKFSDPSAPTISARADAWTKLGAADPSIVGTRVYYEGVGLDKATIDRLLAEKKEAGVRSALDSLVELSKGGSPSLVATSAARASVHQLPPNEEAE